MEDPITPETQTPTVAEESNVSTPSVEEPTNSAVVETEGEEVASVTDIPAETETLTEHQPEKPAERRIRNLVSEVKDLREKNQQLLETAPVQSPQTKTLSSMLEGRESIDPEELDKIGSDFAAQSGTAAADLAVGRLRYEMAQEKAVNQFEKDQMSIESKYDQLNPDKPDYNPALEKIIADKWRSQAVQVNPYNKDLVTIDPKITLSSVAKEYMDVMEIAVNTATANTRTVLTTQQDETALTPNSEAPEAEVAFEDLSLSEMKKRLAASGVELRS